MSSSPAPIPRSNAAGVISLGVPTNMPTTKKKNEKTPMEFIAEIPPIEVDATIAVCDGGQPSQRSTPPHSQHHPPPLRLIV